MFASLYASSQEDSYNWMYEEALGLKTPDESPTWSTCNQNDWNDRKACSDQRLIEFMGKTLVYPIKARKKNTQGVVYVQYIIDERGSFSNLRLVNEIGNGCGQAAITAVLRMQQLGPWKPGVLNGDPIKTLMTQPVTFQLLD